MRSAPQTRLLVACCVGLAVLLAAMAGIEAAGPIRDVRTPLGSVSLPELAAVVVAMAMGGFIARARFRWIAVGLVAATGLASMAAATWLAPSGMPSPGTWLAKNYAFALVLEMAVAALAAAAGEHVARRSAAREGHAGT